MTDPRPRSRVLAATLSFLFPGLGQAYAGRRRMAIALAAPIVILLAVGLVLATLLSDVVRNGLLSSQILIGALVADAALGAWRLFAIGHAAWVTAPRTAGTPARVRQIGSMGLIVVLLVATVGMHAWAGLVINRLDAALGEVFSGGQAPATASGEQHDSVPLNQPEYHWDGTERVTFLLLGLDAGPGRDESLTDTILAVSLDPVAHTAVMVSVPRDTGFVPLPDRSIYADGLYPRKINELATDANERPDLWCPDLVASQAAACGLRSLERSIALYLGAPIQFYAQVDLEGFASLIDAVGGLTLCLPGKMVDPEYGGPTWEGYGIELPPGCSHYDGAHALAYARIRKGWIEQPDGTREYQDDFKRAERQQKVLLELRREFANANIFFELPAILDAVGATVLTDFPRSMAGDLASLLPLITGPEIKREVLALPDFVDPPLNPNVNYLLIPRRADVRAGMLALFGPGTELQGWYLGSEADGPPS